MKITHNISAINSQRQLGIISGGKAKTSEKLASGYQINRAADDAAGLSISEKMRKQVRGLDRGVRNTMDGISLCQVGDGALAEVTDMIHRLEELSVQAANGTNSETDRRSIQNEVDQIKLEVDRIGDTTKFNEVFLFKGSKAKQLDSVTAISETAGSLTFDDFKLASLKLGTQPFDSSSSSNMLGLAVIVDKDGSSFNDSQYNMVFGSGSTSTSSFRITFSDDSTESIPFNSFIVVPNSYHESIATNTVSRDLQFQREDGLKLKVTQTIKIVEGAEDKHYDISYKLKNESDNSAKQIKTLDFMFHVDSAYNNDDYCEAYYTDGNRLTNFSMFIDGPDALSDIIKSQQSEYLYTSLPESLSIIDAENALAFSEKITLTGNGIKGFSLGFYNSINDWGYYNNLSQNLGQNAVNKDLGFSAIYRSNLSGGAAEFGIQYGIVPSESDPNIIGIPVKKSETTPPEEEIKQIIATNPKQIWIQSGADALDGIILQTKEMNSRVLGIDDFNVMTLEKATKSIGKVEGALKYVTALRSLFGAQQNRLEHTVKNESNVVENTQAAESRIRDADMADEMVNLSMKNILEQAGQAMLAQANQTTNGVMSLLQ